MNQMYQIYSAVQWLVLGFEYSDCIEQQATGTERETTDKENTETLKTERKKSIELKIILFEFCSVFVFY